MRSGRIGVRPRYTVPPRAVVCRTQSSQPLMLGRPLMISGMDSISVSAVLVMGGIQEFKNPRISLETGRHPQWGFYSWIPGILGFLDSSPLDWSLVTNVTSVFVKRTTCQGR